MYDRRNRFTKLPTSTSDRVGPGTYNIAGTIGKDGNHFAPFLTLQPRNTFLGNKTSLYQPGPTTYNPCTKEQPKGFVSMDTGVSCFMNVQSEADHPLDSVLVNEEDGDASDKKFPKTYTGKLLSGAMINRQRIPVPSIPLPRGKKRFIFTYDEDRKGYIIQLLPESSTEIQKQLLFHDSMKLKRYKGVYFGNRTETRDSVFLRSDGPGPADYDVSSKTWEVPISYTGKKWLAIHHTKDGKDYITLFEKSQDLLNIANPVRKISFLKGYHSVHTKSDIMRYFDFLIKNATLENIPAPNYYNVTKCLPLSTYKSKVIEKKNKEASLVGIKGRKLHFKRMNSKCKPSSYGFNSSCMRFLTKMSETPGPAEYEVYLNKRHLNVEENPNSAFLQRTSRFQDHRDETPGPGSYDFCSLRDESKNLSRPSHYLPVNWQAPPFGSFVPRAISLSASKETPGPGSYNTQNLWLRGHKNMSAVFKSKTARYTTPPYSTIAKMTHAGDFHMEKMKQLHRSRSDLASRIACKAVFVQSTSKAEKKQRPTGLPRRRLTKTVSMYPFNTTGPRVVNLQIPDYPGPAKYRYEDNIPALNVGYSGRMTSQSERFKISESSPGPADYQKVKSEMNLKTFNVSIESRARCEKMENQKKQNRRKNTSKEAATTSKFDNTIAVCERGGRILIMKKPYKAAPQVRGKERHVFMPSNIRTNMRSSF